MSNDLFESVSQKFDLDVKYVKVNLGSSFKQTWLAPYLISSP